MLKSYKDMFAFDDEKGVRIVEATRVLMTKIWGQPNEIRIEGINSWLQTISAVLEVSVPIFEMVQGEEGRNMYRVTGGGQFVPALDKIILYKKFSLTTLLHEYRHFLQHKKLDIRSVEYPSNVTIPRVIDSETGEVIFEGNVREAMELDARMWSCSLYYKANPEKYNKAVREGKIYFF